MEDKNITYELKEVADMPVEEQEVVVTVTEPAPVVQKCTTTIKDLEIEKEALRQQIEFNESKIALIDEQISEIKKL